MAPDSGSPQAVPRVGIKVTLHIGVLEQPYRTGGKTTGDVAEILEAKYGLFSAFYKAREDEIAGAAGRSVQAALEALHAGRPVDPWGPLCQQVAASFKDFISSREAERVGIPGTPTKAALMGINHRLAHPYRRKNPSRPSFRDTWLLMNSVRGWISER